MLLISTLSVARECSTILSLLFQSSPVSAAAVPACVCVCVFGRVPASFSSFLPPREPASLEIRGSSTLRSLWRVVSSRFYPLLLLLLLHHCSSLRVSFLTHVLTFSRTTWRIVPGRTTLSLTQRLGVADRELFFASSPLCRLVRTRCFSSS